MLILTIRTDKPQTELGLYNSASRLVYETWEAHRQLAETIHYKIRVLLESQDRKLQDIAGIVVFKGPGSFTGLRIGLTVANALAQSLPCSIVATQGDNWLSQGVAKLEAGENETIALPEYGAEPHITEPKK